MSLLQRILHPTVEQYAKWAKDMAIRKVEIRIVRFDAKDGYHTFVGLPKDRTIIRPFKYSEHIDTSRTVLSRAEIERLVLSEALEIAEKLRSQGLEATINGNTIDETRFALGLYPY